MAIEFPRKPAPPPARPAPAPQTEAKSLATRVHDEFLDMERRLKLAEELNADASRDLAVLTQDRDHWRERAQTAEAKMARYAAYAVELITRIGFIRELGGILDRSIVGLVDESKRVAERNDGLPKRPLELAPEDQARLEKIATMFGAGRPEEPEPPADEHGTT
jgi:hypothetical protein